MGVKNTFTDMSVEELRLAIANASRMKLEDLVVCLETELNSRMPAML